MLRKGARPNRKAVGRRSDPEAPLGERGDQGRSRPLSKVSLVTAASVEIVEVSPRDGLQNESQAVSTEDKLRLIERAVNAGIKRLEIASFVNPKRVPQMADAEDVIARAPRAKDITYIGLVMNKRGAELEALLSL